MDLTKIIFIRHGESLGNAKRMMLGHTDLDLSLLGYIQAKTTAENAGFEALAQVIGKN